MTTTTMTSVVTDDDSAQEETPLDDQPRPRKTARDVTAILTYRGDRPSSSDDTKSPPSNMVTGSYKFQIGSSQNVFRRTLGKGRRPLQSSQGNAKVSASAAILSTVNSTGQRSTYQVYCSVCRRYAAENEHPRCSGQAENRSTAAPATSSTTVTAPVVAQHSVSRRQSNSASTAITVTGNNNSMVSYGSECNTSYCTTFQQLH